MPNTSRRSANSTPSTNENTFDFSKFAELEQTLKDKIAEYDKLVSEQKEILNSLNTKAVTPVVEEAPVISKPVEDIHPNKKTKLTSLTYGTLSLHSDTRGFLKFNEYGQTQVINYGQLCDYLLTCRNAFNNGVVYIHDQDMVEELGLSEVYKKMLSSEIVEKIIKGTIELDYISILKDCSNFQKKSFATLMAQKLANGEFADYNVVQRCTEAIGIDIRKLFDEMKQVEAFNKEEQ